MCIRDSQLQSEDSAVAAALQRRMADRAKSRGGGSSRWRSVLMGLVLPAATIALSVLVGLGTRWGSVAFQRASSKCTKKKSEVKSEFARTNDYNFAIARARAPPRTHGSRLTAGARRAGTATHRHRGPREESGGAYGVRGLITT